jgi:transmembrane sensor
LDELIIRVLSGHASTAEEERLSHWRAESSGNESYYRDIEGVWSLTAPRPRRSYEAPADLAAIVAEEGVGGDGVEVTRVVSLAERRRRGVPSRVDLRWVGALAASVAAVALGIRLVGSPTPAVEPVATFAAEAGAVRTVVLADGSFVRLAPGSRLEQWPAEGERRLSLSGRAFFAVTHDASTPFAVDVGDTEIRVLGTRFEVADVVGGGVRAVVVEGRVGVSNEHGRAEAPAGSVAEAPAGAAPTVSAVEDVYALLDWPDGLLVFQATPLRDVAGEVGRHFGRTVEVQGPALEALRISAFFVDEDFEEVVQALCDVSGADCALTPMGARIGPMR